MTGTPQISLDLGHEIVVDLFAGGGGASEGITWALGRGPDVAVNHDPEAIALHRANHPETEHYCESVFKVDPVRATGNRPVGLLWASPDCTHHSKAKGGKPVSKKIRGLAWVVVKWTRRVRPRAIALENVEEFADWGPLTAEDKPCKVRRGQTFKQWVGELERLGYKVEHRILRACDYGAPTIRRRLFVLARRDGRPITWPQPTHAPADDPRVKRGRLQAWRSAAECIDWTIPCPSIFTRRKPLAEATQRRIARGVHRFVIDCPQPFLVGLDHQSSPSAEYSIDEPLTTTTSKARHLLCAPYFIPRHGERDGQEPRTRSVEDPAPTVTATANGASLVAAFVAKHYDGNYKSAGSDLRAPLGTVTARDHNAVIAGHLLNQHGADQRSAALDQPAPTICAGGNHAALVSAFLATYYGNSSVCDVRGPAHTVTSKDRLQLVVIQIDGQAYVLVDIGMRMLQPRELFRANGFPDTYRIDIEVNGKPLTKTAQVRLVGNSVPPQWAKALVAVNFQHEAEVRVA